MLDAMISALIFPAFDWLVVGRLAAYYTNFEYRYWPLSGSRAISAILMDAVVFAVVYLGQGYPLWYMLPFGAVLLYWLIAMMIDINKQRRSYVPPPVSDSKYGG